MHRANWLVIGIALLTCAALLGVGLWLNATDAPAGGTAPLSELPGLAPPGGEGVAQTALPPDALPADTLYLVITAGDRVYEPMPLTAEGDYTLAQEGTDKVNTVHFTPEGACMVSASCKNQDCVAQGEVTRTNRETRPLGNLIICLPNKVTLELCTADELEQHLYPTGGLR
ncbi:MAG: NusG domain II-containing protein [Clostridia bacterium]